jgi:hypothetical protein
VSTIKLGKAYFYHGVPHTSLWAAQTYAMHQQLRTIIVAGFPGQVDHGLADNLARHLVSKSSEVRKILAIGSETTTDEK